MVLALVAWKVACKVAWTAEEAAQQVVAQQVVAHDGELAVDSVDVSFTFVD